MCEKWLRDLPIGASASGPVLVREYQINKSAAGKDYDRLSITDGDLVVNAIMFDTTKDTMGGAIEKGKAYRAEVRAEEYQNAKTYKVVSLMPAPDIASKDFLQKAEINEKLYYDHVHYAAENMDNQILKTITCSILEQYKEAFMTSPAMETGHHAELCGYLYHVYRMLNMACHACAAYKDIQKDYVYAGVILHDIGKLFTIESGEMGVIQKTSYGMLMTPEQMSQAIIQQTASVCGISVFSTEVLNLLNIIESHNVYSKTRPATIEAVLVSQLDTLDAVMTTAETMTESLMPGTFSSAPMKEAGNIYFYRLPESKVKAEEPEGATEEKKNTAAVPDGEVQQASRPSVQTEKPEPEEDDEVPNFG